MIEEIRIYYESYEQALHFIKPSLYIYKNIPILLIKKSKNYKKYSFNLAPIVFWKDQDILISIISNGIEYPIIAVEFSTAVFTEDHELQRSDSLASALENNCLYIKISPTKKKSPSDHGGNTDFDFVEPFKLIYNKTQNIGFHIEWPLLENNNTLIKSDDVFLSCPPQNDEFNEIIKKVSIFLMELKNVDSNWLHIFSKNLLEGKIRLENQLLISWINKFLEKKDFKHNLISSSRININNKGELELKFNRFGHTMDPERGMLVFYGNIYKKIKVKFILDKGNKSWYKDTPKEKIIETLIQKTGLNNRKDLLQAFAYSSGLDTNKEFKDIINIISKDRSIIDINKFIENNYFKLNKALRTIFKYSSSLFLTNGKNSISITMVWNNNKAFFENENNINITPIKERISFDEDDITYITVHQILKVNKAKIISVSYPGAQGDRAVLPESNLGRRQERKYIDVISYISDRYINLNESKGKFNIQEIKKDIDKLSNYKNNKIYRNAFYVLINKISNNIRNKELLISVSFWATLSSNLKDIPIDKLDFFIAINYEKQRWKIWRGGDKNFFNNYEGVVRLEKTYQII